MSKDNREIERGCSAWIKDYWKYMMDEKFEEGLTIKEQFFPDTLFKYRPLSDYTFDQLENNYLWMSTIESLNDPFECSLQFDNDECLRKYFSSTKFQDGFRKLWEKTLTANEIDTIVAHPKPWAKYLDVCASKGLQITLNEEEQVAKMQGRWKQILTESNKSIKICSFSEVNHSLLLWSHYADQHKGICIEYDLLNEEELRAFIQPVLYQDEICKIGLLEELTMLRQIGATLVKSMDWQYEREWRMIHFKRSQEFPERLMVKSPVAIYLGTRFHNNPEDIQLRLLKILHSKNIPVYQMVKHPHEYKVIPEPLDSTL